MTSKWCSASAQNAVTIKSLEYHCTLHAKYKQELPSYRPNCGNNHCTGNNLVRAEYIQNLGAEGL